MTKIERLEKNLVLNRFLLNQLGFSDYNQLLKLLVDVKEGYDEEGKSYFSNILKSQIKIKIPNDKLDSYDFNIKNHLKHINQKRDTHIQLKYFQYLAILFTEIYLDQLFNNPIKFNKDLNEFILEIFKDNYEFLFGSDDLNKLAFWMATGSGKTIILHINHLQLLHYNIGPNEINFDNILLITPNESLSKQHFDEMVKNNISCEIFSQSNQGYFSSMLDPSIVKIIDIHKLTEEKKGQGVTIDVEFFGSKNIIFVDEGHKGSGGEKWKNFREFISREGFTFEYSATFGQAINRPSAYQEELLQDYSKSIIFDYSYHYFHNDGFGKDYRILNLKENTYKESKDTLMLANLLTFYEQKLIYVNHKDEIRDYNIEDPLWIFVGSKVSGKNQQSDIFEIIVFITNFLQNKDGWVFDLIKDILAGKSGIFDKNNRDIFSPMYPERKLDFLRKHTTDPKQIYQQILETIFHSTTSSKLQLVDLKKAEGEIALKLVNSNYFGIINIGDKSTFLKLVISKGKNIFDIQEDVFSKSIFGEINRKGSDINILIGAKKFIEGWDSWRVSNMGLLNIGKREGTQIIQLFGRGVRLKGRKMSLKRSSSTPGNHPAYLSKLESLNIFGIKANYMEQFRDFLASEGINTENLIEFSIPLRIKDEHLKKDLQIPVVNENIFLIKHLFELQLDTNVNVKLDLIPKGELIESQEAQAIQATSTKKAYPIPNEYLALFDWDDIFFDLYNYRSDREWWNIIFTKDTLFDIINKQQYSLYCIPKMLQIKKFEEIKRLEDIVKQILRKYLHSYYNRIKNYWMQNNISLETLTEAHGNFKDYRIYISEKHPLIVSEIKNLIENNLEDFLNGKVTSAYLRNTFYENHLFQPLLVEVKNFTITPTGILESGEEEFLKHLKSFIAKKPPILQDKEIYLLRNLPKLGVGFFENYYFYPDFILWILDGEKQHIVFVDPKGLGYMHKGEESQKIKLHKDIKNIEQILTKRYHKQVTLDSFIISVSEYNDIKFNFTKNKIGLESENVFFQDDKNHITKLFSKVLTGSVTT